MKYYSEDEKRKLLINIHNEVYNSMHNYKCMIRDAPMHNFSEIVTDCIVTAVDAAFEEFFNNLKSEHELDNILLDIKDQSTNDNNQN